MPATTNMTIKPTMPTTPNTPTAPDIRPARPEDAAACVVLRGQTRQNAISAARLAELGITAASWGEDIRSGALPGHVAWDGERMLGYCFGERASGEVVVLALLPECEGQGLGRRLLLQVMADLQGFGHQRLFLGCSADPQSRSHGFYRHLGWRSTGTVDRHGDELLEWHAPAGSVATPAAPAASA